MIYEIYTYQIKSAKNDSGDIDWEPIPSYCHQRSVWCWGVEIIINTRDYPPLPNNKQHCHNLDFQLHDGELSGSFCVFTEEPYDEGEYITINHEPRLAHIERTTLTLKGIYRPLA